mmetsp:Transcript_10083/g.42405  ORF Transcript_10083/g.42405 Transcript_10083/m.42405 type:complete len:525 (-) Transcript_10083:193-1767(-)
MITRALRLCSGHEHRGERSVVGQVELLGRGPHAPRHGLGESRGGDGEVASRPRGLGGSLQSSRRVRAAEAFVSASIERHLLELVLVHGEAREDGRGRRGGHQVAHHVPRSFLDVLAFSDRAVRRFHRLDVQLANELAEVHAPVTVLVAVLVQQSHLALDEARRALAREVQHPHSDEKLLLRDAAVVVDVEKRKRPLVAPQTALEHLGLDHGVYRRLPRGRGGVVVRARALPRGVQNPHVVHPDALAVVVQVRDPPVARRVSIFILRRLRRLRLRLDRRVVRRGRAGTGRFERAHEPLRAEEPRNRAARRAVEVAAHHHRKTPRRRRGTLRQRAARRLLVLVQVLQDLERLAQPDERRVAVVREQQVRVHQKHVPERSGRGRVCAARGAKVHERRNAVPAVVEEDIPRLHHLERVVAHRGQKPVRTVARARRDVERVPRATQPGGVQLRRRRVGVPKFLQTHARGVEPGDQVEHARLAVQRGRAVRRLHRGRAVRLLHALVARREHVERGDRQARPVGRGRRRGG